MKKYINILTTIFLLIYCQHSLAQISIDSVKNELIRIDQAYDDAFFLTCDIGMIYNTDTIPGNGNKFDRSEITGKYTFHKKNTFYLLDQIEYMQNERYSIAVYKNDKFILVGKPIQKGMGSFLPMRELIDSFIIKIDSAFDINIIADAAQEDNKTIIFTAKNASTSLYEKINISYNSKKHLLNTISYRIKEYNGDYGVEAVGLANARKTNFTMNFLNYRVEKVDNSIFEETQYIQFKSPTEFEPVANYSEFTLYNNVNDK